MKLLAAVAAATTAQPWAGLADGIAGLQRRHELNAVKNSAFVFVKPTPDAADDRARQEQTEGAPSPSCRKSHPAH